MPEINSINIGGVSYSLGGGGGSGDSAAIEDIKKLLFPSITTVGEEGTPVTFTKGDRVLTKIPDESGVVTEYLPELGTWTVETEIGGIELSRDVECQSIGDSYKVLYPIVSIPSEENGVITFSKGNVSIEKISGGGSISSVA